jgi:hypothetical protein
MIIKINASFYNGKEEIRKILLMHYLCRCNKDIPKREQKWQLYLRVNSSIFYVSFLHA